MAMNLLIEAGKKRQEDQRPRKTLGNHQAEAIWTTLPSPLPHTYRQGTKSHGGNSNMGPNEVQTIQIKMFSCQERKDHTKIQVGNPEGRNTINYIKSIKWYSDTLKDVNNSRRLERGTTEKLVNIDKASLSRKFKAWVFQHGLLTRLIWPLMLFDIAITTVESIRGKSTNISDDGWEYHRADMK